MPALDEIPAEDAASSAPQVVTVSTCAAGLDEAGLRRRRALRHLDALRQAAGAGGLVRSQELELSAGWHAAYLSRNGLRSAPTVHAETAGLPGFTGADPFVRMRTAGYRPAYATEVIGDVGSTAGDSDCVDHLMNTIYHAALLLSRVTEAGVAFGEGAYAGTCTIDLGTPLGATSEPGPGPGPEPGPGPGPGEIVRYPWPGMVATVGSFQVGSENPRPPPSRLPNANAGLPVLAGLRNADFLAAAPAAHVEIQRFDLSDSNGRLVPSVVFADSLISGRGVVSDVGLHGLFAALVPEVPLLPGRYQVTLRATIGTQAIASTPWWFSVAAP